MPTPNVVRAEDVDARFMSSIKALRADRGWSQDQLAEALRQHGIGDATQVTVSRMEAGKRQVRLGEALAISEIFDLPISALTNPSGIAGAVSAMHRLAQEALDDVARFQDAAVELAAVVNRTGFHYRQIDRLIAEEDLSPDLLASATRSRSFLRQIAEYDAAEDVSGIIRSIQERADQVAQGAPPMPNRKVFAFEAQRAGMVEILRDEKEAAHGEHKEAP